MRVDDVRTMSAVVQMASQTVGNQTVDPHHNSTTNHETAVLNATFVNANGILILEEFYGAYSVHCPLAEVSRWLFGRRSVGRSHCPHTHQAQVRYCTPPSLTKCALVHCFVHFFDCRWTCSSWVCCFGVCVRVRACVRACRGLQLSLIHI